MVFSILMTLKPSHPTNCDGFVASQTHAPGGPTAKEPDRIGRNPYRKHVHICEHLSAWSVTLMAVYMHLQCNELILWQVLPIMNSGLVDINTHGNCNLNRVKVSHGIWNLE
jgi:hypothetical protein